MRIESTQNPRLKAILALRDRRDRDETHQFLIEGFREVQRALQCHWILKELLFCPAFFLGSHEEALLKLALQQGAQLIECSENAFKKISYRDRPDGILAVAPQRRLGLQDLPKVSNPLWVVAEAIEKPGNLGTILRSADAVGAHGVILCDPVTDLFNPNVVRASVGTLFHVPVAQVTSEEALQWLKSTGCHIVAATPHAKKSYVDVDLTRPLAIAFGTEQIGLSELWLQQADLPVSLPMMGIADSLNVAMAATVLLYEVLRQRRALSFQ